MIEYLNNLILTLSNHLPIEIFIFIGSLAEELFAPIPSFIVTATSGTLAFEKGYPFFALFILGLLASAGKTMGSVIIYYLSDKAENIITSKFGKKLGIKHEEIERIGSYFKGTYKDYIILTAIRTMPVIPSTPVCVACGVLRIKMKLYVISTFIGDYFRSMFLIIAGYLGFSSYKELASKFKGGDAMIIEIISIILVLIAIYFFYKYRENILTRFEKIFKK